MTSNDTPEQEIERTLQSHFEAEAARLRAPADLWERIEGRLEEPLVPGQQTPAWRRIFTPRQLGLASALVTVTVVLFALSGAWLFIPGGAKQSAVLAEKEMTLEEVLALRKDAIISFKKQNNEPIDFFVNDRRVGAGKAIKSGEKFGIYISEVGTPKETIEKLA